MNYIIHQNKIFNLMDANINIKPVHISLYLALFRIWNQNKFTNPISVNRQILMQMSKISSPNTYTKVLKDLELYGFIRYHPSYDPTKGSSVYLYVFDQGIEYVSVSSVIPTHKQTNNLILKNEDMNEKKTNVFHVPPLEHVQIYFEQKGFLKVEGERFFNYYESNGWLVGGRSKMKDWKAAARNWMLNIKNYQSSTPNKTVSSKKPTTNQRKQFSGNNYQEPL